MQASLDQFRTSAITPDQLLPYVAAVSGLEPRVIGPCIGHVADDGAGVDLVLVAYPLHAPRDAQAMNAAVEMALATPRLRHITVLAHDRPTAAPADAVESRDAYWSLPLPLPQAGQKLRNLLRRARRDIHIVQSGGPASWTAEHALLAGQFCTRPDVEDGSKYLFRHLGNYLEQVEGARLFSAHDSDNRLVACAIADYSSFATSFYMFAFRSPQAPPGTADALLESLAAEGASRGHTLLNLGLGINAGVTFFKKKWGAEPFLPLVETAWSVQPPKRSLWARIFGS